MTSSTEGTVVPNHHADHPGFSGVRGAVAALTMAAHRSVGRLAVDLTGVTAQDHVVDVGCGSGRDARAAARRGATVVGVDPSPVMLRTARLLSLGRRITWTEGVAEALPAPTESASVLWSIATVHHWRDIEAGVAECARVLRPAGRLLAVERGRSEDATGLASHGWTEAQADAFAEVVERHGFDDVRVERHESLLCVRAVRP